MIRACGAVEIRLMARVACSRRICVVVVRVTLRAGERGMRSAQRIVGIQRVIKVDVRPVCCVVARFAGGWEAGGNVAGIRRSFPIGLVTSVASRRQRAVVVVRVTLRAGQRGVCPSQRKYRSVIERRGRPRTCCVAKRAVCRKSRGHVIRILRAGEVRLMAAVTRCRCACVNIIRMACRAGQCGVRSGKRIAGVLEVVKFRVEPRIHGVAGFAGSGEARRRVIEHWRLEI